MAVAARPGPSDARVPCPLCGGLIHPIAGKCKHCKADLSAYRSARPAAAAPLPALNGMPAAPYQNGHATPAAPVPQQQVNLQALAAQDASQPILPPRPTGRMHAAEAKPSAWRSWPVVVIVLAMLAIVTAVVLMVWPAHKDQAGKHALQPPPAPERMDTNQLQEQPIPPPPHDPASKPGAGGGGADPWSQPHSQIDPPVPQAPQMPQAPQDDPDVDDLKDPFTPGGSTLHAGTGMATIAMVAHLCKKLTQCGTTDVTMKGLCDSFGHNMSAPSNCPAAERCIEHIDTMSCGDSGDITLDAMSVMTQFHDCAEAIKC